MVDLDIFYNYGFFDNFLKGKNSALIFLLDPEFCKMEGIAKSPLALCSRKEEIEILFNVKQYKVLTQCMEINSGEAFCLLNSHAHDILK